MVPPVSPPVMMVAMLSRAVEQPSSGVDADAGEELGIRERGS